MTKGEGIMISIFDGILFLCLVTLFVLHRLHVIQRRNQDSISGVKKITNEVQNMVEQKQRVIEALAIEANAVERNVAGIFQEIAHRTDLIQKMHTEMRAEKLRIEQLSKKNKQFFDIVPEAHTVQENLERIITQADGVRTDVIAKISQAQTMLEQCDVRETHLHDRLGRLENQMHSVVESGKETMRNLIGDISCHADDVLEKTEHKFSEYENRYTEKIHDTLGEYKDLFEKETNHISKNTFEKFQEYIHEIDSHKKEYNVFIDSQKQMMATLKSETFSELEEAVSSKHHKLAQILSTFDEKLEYSLNTLQEKHNQEVAEIKQSSATITNMVQNLESETRNTCTEVQEQYNVLQVSTTEELTEISQHQKLVEAQLYKTQEEMISVRESVCRECDNSTKEYQKLWAKKIQDYEVQLEESIAKHKEQIATLCVSHEEILHDIMQEYEKEKNNAFQTINVHLTNHIDNSIEDAHTFIKEHFDIKKRELEETMQNMHTERKEQILQVLHEYKTFYDNAQMQYEQKNEYLEQKHVEYAQKIKELETTITAQLKNYTKIIEDRTEADVFRIVDDVNKSLEQVKSSIDNTEDTMQQKITSMQEHFNSSEEVIEHKLQSIQRLVSVLQEKHQKQVTLMDEDTESIKTLEKLHLDIDKNFVKSEAILVDLKAKYVESEKLEKKLHNISKDVDALNDVLGVVKNKDLELRRIIKDHEKMSKQVDKIDVRSGKIHETIELLQSKEEKIRRVKESLTEIQIMQKDIEKHKKGIENDKAQYQLVQDSINSLEHEVNSLEEKSNSLQDTMNNWKEQIDQTSETITTITKSQEEIQSIAAKVDATKKNIPEIVHKLSEIKDEQGRVAELETRLQKLNEEAANKLTLLSLVTTPSQRKGKTTKIDEKTKDIIVGLNENSFKPDRIAKIVGISTNEVQMVLENMFIK